MTSTRTSPPFIVTPTSNHNIVVAQRLSDAGNAVGTAFQACAACFSPHTGGGIIVVGSCSAGCGRVIAMDEKIGRAHV